tara:strand:- start:510 stop:641 length:132 start_codon:yes stop_codon:yes gene_type:complete
MHFGELDKSEEDLRFLIYLRISLRPKRERWIRSKKRAREKIQT